MFICICRTLAIVCATVYLYVDTPKGFFPQQDMGRLGGGMQAQQDISFEALRQKLFAFARIVQADPAVDHVVDSTQGSNSGRMFVVLKPLGKRGAPNPHISADQVIARLRPKMSHIPGASLFLQTAQELQVGGRQSNAQYQYTLSSQSLDDLETWTPILMARLKQLHILADVNNDHHIHELQMDGVSD